MVRNYKRKTNRQQWSKQQMVEAVNAIANGEMSLNRASNEHSIPKSTLLRYYHKAKIEGIKKDDFKMGSFKTTFTEEQENKLRQYIRDVNLSLGALTSLELRRIAFQYAQKNGISHNFNRKTQLAGYDWYKNFMRRNEKLEKNIENENNPSLLFSHGLNVTYSTEKYFKLLADLQQFYKFPPSRIYNVHDRGIISIPNLTSKMFSSTDKKLSTVDFVTVISCCNATGNFIPPLMVYPAEEEDPDFAKGCPEGTKLVCHPSGSIQHNILYPAWFNHFVNYAQPNQANPILLLLDGRGLHMKNYSFIEKAKEFNIYILSIPVILSDNLYPLEIKFMKDLKEYYNEEQSKWTEENKGKLIDLKCIGKIYNSAYTKAAIPEGLIEAFKECGIYPLNPHVLANQKNCPTEETDNIPIYAENTSDESCSSTQTKNYGISVKDPSDINNSFSNAEDVSYNFFDDLIEDQEEKCSEIIIKKEEVPLISNHQEKNSVPFETIYCEEESFQYCD